jgi:hypothetical protein
MEAVKIPKMQSSARVGTAKAFHKGAPVEPEPPREYELEEIKLADIMDPIVENYLAQRAYEMKEFPPIDLHYKTGNTKLAICGLASTTRDFAPFDDMTWDIWSCHMGPEILPRCTMSFESHEVEEFSKPQYTDSKYYEKMCKAEPPWNIPILMRKHFDEIPNSYPYPIDEIVKQFGRYFTNSITYLIALAIRQRYSEIALYGVEMEHGSEYIDQARSVVHFIGIAAGMGIKVLIPPVCQLMKNRWLYGFETDQKDQDCQRIEKYRDDLQQQAGQFGAQMNAMQTTVVKIEGNIQELERMHAALPDFEKEKIEERLNLLRQESLQAQAALQQAQQMVWKNQGNQEGCDIIIRRILQADYA